jgi:peptidoglycan hydrolase-like protein with peptidoglycan-binding domain
MALTLAQLRDNLDGLGYHLSPRGLYGLGDRNNACDNSVLGNIDPNTLCIQDFSLEAYTQSAIYQFQVDHQLVATGQNGPDLQERVEQTVRIFQNNLKIFLKSIGNATQLPVSGYYGPQTLETTKIYQRHKRIPATGIATHVVRKMLDDDAKRILGKPPTPPTSDLSRQLANLKQSHQQRLISDRDLIESVYKLAP